jgi:arabinose-5-phosphate isomerase
MKSPAKSEISRRTETPLDTARRVLDIEAKAIIEASRRLDAGFERAVDLVMACRGRIVVTGMGKSGQVCRKIAATLASTGTSAFFLHAAEASHGDLGMLARGDACLAISNSGTTRELVALLPAMKRLSVPIIAITGGRHSPLAENADVVLDAGVEVEACPLGLAPTASTTVQLAVGDALAVAVLERRGFSSEDFGLLHPGGALGKRLLRVADLMRPHSEVPRVTETDPLAVVLETMTRGGLGVVGVVGDRGGLLGVVTDGDIRRALLRDSQIQTRAGGELMSRTPKTVAANALAAEALATMERHSITSLFIIDESTRAPIGVIHLHDLLRADVA